MKKLTLILTSLLALQPVLIGESPTLKPATKTIRQRIAEYRDTVVAHGKYICGALGCSLFAYWVYASNRQAVAPVPVEPNKKDRNNPLPAAGARNANQASGAFTNPNAAPGGPRRNSNAASAVPPAPPADPNGLSNFVLLQQAAELKRLKDAHSKKIADQPISTPAAAPRISPQENDGDVDALDLIANDPLPPPTPSSATPSAAARAQDYEAELDRRAQIDEKIYSAQAHAAENYDPNPNDDAAIAAALARSLTPPTPRRTIAPSSRKVHIAQGMNDGERQQISAEYEAKHAHNNKQRETQSIYSQQVLLERLEAADVEAARQASLSDQQAIEDRARGLKQHVQDQLIQQPNGQASALQQMATAIQAALVQEQANQDALERATLERFEALKKEKDAAAALAATQLPPSGILIRPTTPKPVVPVEANDPEPDAPPAISPEAVWERRSKILKQAAAEELPPPDESAARALEKRRLALAALKARLAQGNNNPPAAE
jgi:hypothetical protein